MVKASVALLVAISSWALLPVQAQPFPSDTYTVVDPTHPAIVYSPYNWNVIAGSATTINAGAYLKTLFGGTSLAITTNTATNQSPYSQLWIRVDGQAWVLYKLSWANPSFIVARGLQNRSHLLELVVKSTSETIPRWSHSATVVNLTGFVIDAGQSLEAPRRRSKNILIFGDSITEGVRTVNATAPEDTDRNDILGDYSYAIGTAFDAEVGIVGFGATGFTVAGTGGVPSLPNTYREIYAGAPRSFTAPAPDLVIYNEGTNDSAPVGAALQMVINGILALAPTSRHLVLIPFNNSHASEIADAVNGLALANVTYRSTSGLFNVKDSSDGLHPYNYSHIGLIAPQLFPMIRSVLYPGT